ncbi:MAG: hypothetical protein OHK0046_47470 [Anaerolineae bacterium]
MKVAVSNQGNTGTKTLVQEVTLKKGGALKSIDGDPYFDYLPSVRAQMSADQFEGFETVDVNYIEWDGTTFAAGDDVIDIRSAYVEQSKGEGRWGEDFQRMMVALGLARSGVGEEGPEDVLLVMVAPPDKGWPTYVERINKAFVGQQLRISINGHEYQQNIKAVKVYPEGVVAGGVLTFNSQGEVANKSGLVGDTVFIGGGGQTVEAVQTVNGSMVIDQLAYNSYDYAGMHHHVLIPLMEWARQFPDYAKVQLHDLEQVIRLGQTVGDWVLSRGNTSKDLRQVVQQLYERYAIWIDNNIIVSDPRIRGFRGITRVMFPGGGLEMAIPTFHAKYGDRTKFVDLSEFDWCAGVDNVTAENFGALWITLAAMQRGAVIRDGQLTK